MPIYEYECTCCHQVTEVWQSFSDDPATTCPNCSGDLKKIISMSSFQLKGGGWYSDGYCDNGSTSCAPKNGKSNAKKNGSTGKAANGPANCAKQESSSSAKSAS
ncbi:MAG: zinc ribbon domain-containing protein [Thermodesulfobacteriota bacterium]|nr:zinc ribbon domain-containing protein [Thermodesulfobacteriota bacterium]